MTATVAGIHLGIDTHANRLAANTVLDGSFYSCGDHDLIYKSSFSGNSWATWATLGATVAEILDLPTAETDDTLVLAPDGAGGVEFRPGAASHSYLGTNAIGSSSEAAVAHTWYAKSMTAPANGILTSIGVYWNSNANGATPTWGTAVWGDSTGPSGPPLHASTHGAIGMDTVSDADPENPGWVEMPCGLYVPSGTVIWVGVQPSTTTAALFLETTGGTDRTWDHSASLAIGAGYVAITTTTKDYSIRGSFLAL